MNMDYGTPRTRARAGRSDQDQDQGANVLSPNRAENLSSFPRCEKSSQKSIGSVPVEQHCAELEAELTRVKAAASIDLQSVQNLLLAETRKVNLLKTEIAKRDDATPEAGDAKELLVLWRDTIREGHKGTDISLDSDRGRAVLRAVQRRGKERVRRAILGCRFDDWAMGRTSKQDRAFNDVAKHILHDSDRFEHFEQLFLKHHPEAQTVVPQKPQLSLVPTERLTPFDRVLERLPKGRIYEEGVMSACPLCRDSLFVRVLSRPSGEMVLLDCYGVPACDRADVLLALGLDAADTVETRQVLDEHPLSWRLPEHLASAMRSLLALGVVGEEAA